MLIDCFSQRVGLYIYIRGGTVHRCHGFVRTLGSGVTVQYDFGTNMKKKEIYHDQFLFIYFEQTVVQIKKNPSRCENTKYYYMLYI